MKNITLPTVALGLLLGATAIHAEPIHPGLTDKWRFTGVLIDQGGDAKVRSTAPGDPEREIDLDDLGVDDSEVTGQLSAHWRINDKWAMTFAYTDFSLDGFVENDRLFNFNGVEFPINTTIDTSFDVSIIVAAADYSFHQSDTTEIGVGVGLHAIDLDLAMHGSINGFRTQSASEDFLAPLPNIRAYVRHALNDKWMLHGTLGWFGAEVGDYEGDLLIGLVSIDYRFNDNWSLGATAQITDIDLLVTDNASEDEYDIQLPAYGLTLSYSIPK